MKFFDHVYLLSVGKINKKHGEFLINQLRELKVHDGLFIFFHKEFDAKENLSL